MKKLPILFIAFFCILPLWADDPADKADNARGAEFDEIRKYALNAAGGENTDEPAPEENAEASSGAESGEPKKEKETFRFKNRLFEVGFAGVQASVANNFLTSKDIFKKTAVIDLDELTGEFRLDAYADIRPLYFNFNWKNEWGSVLISPGSRVLAMQIFLKHCST